MKKLIKLFLSSMLILSVVIDKHVHDENCGYNPINETGCIYETDTNGLLPDDDDPLE